jgi:hypothetical protein
MIKIFKNIFATEVTEATEVLKTKKKHRIFVTRGLPPLPQLLVLFVFSFYTSVLSVNSVAEKFQNFIDPGRPVY